MLITTGFRNFFLEKINSTNSRIPKTLQHLGRYTAAGCDLKLPYCSSSQQRPCRYIIIIKITGAAASTYSFVQADPTGIQVVVADPTGKTDFTGWTALYCTTLIPELTKIDTKKNRHKIPDSDIG